MNRKLGINGPMVPSVGLGCMGMSGAYGQSDERESISTIERALELGHNFLNTADYYLAGHNEMLIGQAIKGKRDKAFLSVKTGMMVSPMGPGPVNGHPDYIRNVVMHSLQRLKTDYIDLYTLGRVDLNVPIEETVGTMAELVEKDGRNFRRIFKYRKIADRRDTVCPIYCRSVSCLTCYLSDMLRSLTGQNAQQHIHHTLIEKAKEKISTSDLTISEIAYELGFEHTSSFNKLFKSKTNLSPLAYRQSFN